MRVTVLGCGLIGGSLALALARAGDVVTLHDAQPGAAQEIARRGGGIAAGTLAAALAGAEVVAITAPTSALPGLLEAIAAAGGSAPVFDVGGFKADVVVAGERALGARFVGTHPMGGNAGQGATSADPAIFAARPVAITPTPATHARALELVEALWRRAGGVPLRIDAAVHDHAMVAVSHLPHVAAYALAAIAGTSDDVRRLAGPSWDSGTRVAGSTIEPWVAGFVKARAGLGPACRALAARIEAIGAAAEQGDEALLAALLTEGREARRTVRGS